MNQISQFSNRKMTFFNEIKNTILEIPSEFPVFFYLGVGTAAWMREADGSLAMANYHQYPPFVQNLHNNFPTLRVILGLIDPSQENPPYVVKAKQLSPKSPPDQYTNQAGTLQVHVWRKSVYTEADVETHENPSANTVNITEELRQLNAFIIQQRVSFLYHDFTGRLVRLVAEYFDSELREHLDHVIYGMSARTDHGCYFDLTQENAFFPLRLEGNLAPRNAPHLLARAPYIENNARPLIKMFNYYKFIVTRTLPEVQMEIQQYPPEMVAHLISCQKNEIIDEFRTRFKNINLGVLRQVRFVMLHPDDEKADELQNQHTYLFLNIIPKRQRAPFLEILQAKEYKTLYEILFDYVAGQLNIYTQLKGLDITGTEMLNFITVDADPYKWYNNVKNFM
jgi:hypothetical protein